MRLLKRVRHYPTDAIPVFIFKSEIEAQINILSFHALVLEACRRFPKERLKDWERQYWINFVKRLRNKQEAQPIAAPFLFSERFGAESMLRRLRGVRAACRNPEQSEGATS